MITGKPQVSSVLFGTASLRKRSRSLSYLFSNKDNHPDTSTEKLLNQHRQEPHNRTLQAAQLGFFRSAWRLSRPYWFEDFKSTWKEKLIAWSLLFTTLGLTYYQVNEVAVGFNDWKGVAGDFIQNAFNAAAGGPEAASKAWIGFLDLMADLFTLTAKLLVSGAINYKAVQHMILRWRKSMTESFTERWTKNKAYYHMQFNLNPIDNPDQRIHEDPQKFSDAAIDIGTDAFDTTLSFVTFSGILWTLSNDFNLAAIGGPNIILPKFMFWLVMGYAALGTTLTHIASKPLEKRVQDQQKYDATFRAGLINIREKAEPIAQNGSEEVQRGILRESFNKVYQNYRKIINIKTGLLLLRVLYHRLANVVPLVVGFPEVVSGNMQMGGVFKVSGAFGEVKSAMSWYVTNAVLVRQTKATMNRLIEFDDVLKRLEEEHTLSGKDDPSWRSRSAAPLHALWT